MGAHTGCKNRKEGIPRFTVEREEISRFQLITSTHPVGIVKAKRENKSQFNHLGWAEF